MDRNTEHLTDDIVKRIADGCLAVMAVIHALVQAVHDRVYIEWGPPEQLRLEVVFDGVDLAFQGLRTALSAPGLGFSDTGDTLIRVDFDNESLDNRSRGPGRYLERYLEGYV